MDSMSAHDDDVSLMNRILLLGYLILAALVLVFVAMVMDQIHSSDARVLAVVLMLLMAADFALQRRRQP
jgi:L-asparagine transporter-like permease